MDLTDENLISRLKNCEDHFVERKTSGDRKDDWVKTAVAFANSAPMDYPCVLYIGVRDNGELEEREIDFDGVQKKFNKEMTFVYPRIPYLTKVINVEGRQCLAIMVFGSPQRPHFSGPAYVRVGSETRNASEGQYEQMFASRSSKASKLLEFKGKAVSVINRTHSGGAVSESGWGGQVFVEDCNSSYLTLKQLPYSLYSFPLSRIDICFDHVLEMLRIEIDR